MPRRQNPLVASEFTVVLNLHNGKDPWLQCRHCLWKKVKNVTRASEHLDTEKQESQSSQPKRQGTLALISFRMPNPERLPEMAAMAVYTSARPFTRQYIISVSGRGYEPPDHRRLGGDLLIQACKKTKVQVDPLINGQQFLNFILDELMNI